MITRYHIDEIPVALSKQEAFKDIECTFDTAIPQSILDAMVEESGLPYHLVLSSTVWAYPKEYMYFGTPVSCIYEIQEAWNRFSNLEETPNV